MNRKEVIYILEKQTIQIDEKKKKETIQLTKEKIEEKQQMRFSIINLFVTTFRFISIKSWLLQFTAVLTGIYSMYFSMGHSITVSMRINTLTIIVLFSLLFISGEIFRSFTFGMWELEKTFKYDLRQYLLVKIIIIGLTELIVIGVLSLFYQQLFECSFWRVAIYMLVPFNIFCILILALLTLFRNRIKTAFLWGCAGIFISVFLGLNLNCNVYMISIRIWSFAYCITTGIFFLIIYEIWKKNWEVSR